MIKTNSIFWGYKYLNGDFKIKPFYSYDVIDDARINPSLEVIIKPFKANNFNDALNKLKNNQINEKIYTKQKSTGFL
jgi:hypothetical protein